MLEVFLSYWPVRNLISHHQRMNASFNPFHLVNTYGAFGGISRTRQEVVIEGTDEERSPIGRCGGIRVQGQAGAVRRLPPQWAPYHLRLDWLMWFAAISPLYAQQWLGPFLVRLLENDPATLRLLRHNPFPTSPPRYVRAQLYRYRFTTVRSCCASARGGIARWWVRIPAHHARDDRVPAHAERLKGSCG